MQLITHEFIQCCVKKNQTANKQILVWYGRHNTQAILALGERTKQVRNYNVL
jgi:hypothetical protein